MIVLSFGIFIFDFVLLLVAVFLLACIIVVFGVVCRLTFVFCLAFVV